MDYKTAFDLLLKRGVTAYELHKYSGKSEAGLRKLLSGDVINPRRSTKELIINFAKKITDEETRLNQINTEFTKGLEKFTPTQISTYILNNKELFKKEKLIEKLYEISLLEKANELVEEKLKNSIK